MAKKRKRPAGSDNRVNKRAKAAKPKASDGGVDLWQKLLNALREQFPGKKNLDKKKKAFEDFLREIASAEQEAKDDLPAFLYGSCCSCSSFKDDIKKSGKAVLEKCQKVVDELLDYSSDVTEVEEDETLAEERTASAWRADYRDDNNVVELFLEHIQNCNAAYKLLGDWHSPYIALCQSSGWGKSRLLSELGKKIPVLYLSFLKQKSSGFPKRTQQTIENLMGSKPTGVAYRLDRSLWLKTIRHVDNLYSNAPNKQMIVLDEQDFDWANLKRKASPKKVNLKNELIVIAFDEANEMLNEKQALFRATRHLLQKLHDSTGKKVFGVMADTNSRVFNFAPKVADDPSAKSIENSLDLFPPFVLGGFNNCFERNDGLNMKKPQSMLGYGRPLWGAIFSQQLYEPEEWESETAAKYAATKLFGRRLPKKWSSKYYMQAISCIFARLGIYLSPGSSATWHLTAKHMATLLAVSSDRENILVTYTSEPVLAMGAAFLWARESLLVDYLLPSLRHALMQGLVLEGNLGETVACIVLLLAMDKMSTSGYYHGEFCLLDTFLQQLGAAEDDVEELRNGVPASAMIGFGHFVPWHRYLDKADLAVLLRHRAAAILRRNHRGADLLLPLWWEKDKPCDETIEYGFVLVQVKNRAQAANLAEAGYKLSNNYVFESQNELRDLLSVKVLMDLGLAAQKTNDSTCLRMSPTKDEHGFACKKKALDGLYEDISIKTRSASKSVNQLATNHIFHLLSIKGFDHLPIVKKLKGEKKEINENEEGKMGERDTGKREESETIESEKEDIEESSKLKSMLKGLLVGPVYSETWYASECRMKGDKGIKVPGNFFVNMLLDGMKSKVLENRV